MKLRELIKDMSLIDWLLLVLFVGLVSFACESLLPGYGWGIGALVGLLLAVVAIRKRGKLLDDDDDQKED